MTVLSAPIGLMTQGAPADLVGRHRAASPLAGIGSRTADARRVGLGRTVLAVAGFLGNAASLMALLVIAGALVGLINGTPAGDGVRQTVDSSASAHP